MVYIPRKSTTKVRGIELNFSGKWIRFNELLLYNINWICVLANICYYMARKTNERRLTKVWGIDSELIKQQRSKEIILFLRTKLE